MGVPENVPEKPRHIHGYADFRRTTTAWPKNQALILSGLPRRHPEIVPV